MPIDDLSEQYSLVQSALSNIKHSDDAQLGKNILSHVEAARATRQQKLDKQQETLQLLSRRLQTARSRVDASRAQREEKSHAETMREMELERQSVNQVIGAQEAWREELKEKVLLLERQIKELNDHVEMDKVPDDNVLMLQVLRGLGVEPLFADDNSVESVRLWSESEACVVPLAANDTQQLPPDQLAAQLWDLCL
ncbi:hypothetical protein J3B02_004074 [Coemansia erecta]|nr:hypothetical protein J3B02_004074 [Coemansia erecta]KAJ2861890.1 hypothetical protein FB639_005452 [Coemansia asiatica]